MYGMYGQQKGGATLASQDAPVKETRQEYATRRVQQYQREFPTATFAEILSVFQYAGRQYDAGELVAA